MSFISPMRIELLDRTNQQDVQQVIHLVNLAFLSDSFFKVPTKCQRLKTSSKDLIGIESIEEILEQGSEFLILRSNEEIIGCIRMEAQESNSAGGGSFGMLSISPEHQRQHLGTKLVLECEKYLIKQKKCKYIEILVINIRKDVVQFYEKLNYITGQEELDVDEVIGDNIVNAEYKGVVKFIKMRKNLI
jgi:ribosomal protein S18 acetylase RimI-like enzyme